MTLNTNIKGYINGDEWGVFEKPLLTYEEIVAMATAEGSPWTNTIAALNAAPADYYDDLSSGNHLTSELIVSVQPYITAYRIRGIEYESSRSWYDVIYYYNGQWNFGAYTTAEPA